MNEKGTGGSSPCSAGKREKSMLRRCSRGGVPVLSRPHSKPTDLSDSARSRDGGSPARPAGRCSGPTWTRPLRNVPVVTTSASQPIDVAVFERQAGDAAVLDDDSSGATDDPGNSALPFERASHPRAVDRLVRLRPRRPDRRAAAPVQQLELDRRGIDREAHQSAERIDLADEMSFRRAANRGIARHVRHGVERQRADGDVEPHAAPPPTPLPRRRAPHR